MMCARTKNDHLRPCRGRWIATALAVVASFAGGPFGQHVSPVEIRVSPGNPDERVGTFSQRSLRVALEVDRNGARLLAYTVKDAPLVQPLVERTDPKTSSIRSGREAILEVSLADDRGRRHVRRVGLPALCLRHDPEAWPHVEGDTIRLHRDSVVVDLPELPGFDRLEIAQVSGNGSRAGRVLLGRERLDAARFTRAGGSLAYETLAIAGGGAGAARSTRDAGSVHWPEEYSDADTVRVYGNAVEGSARINVTIVPDGYTFGEKAVMEEHAAALVAAFRARAPYAQHDPFINYTLVYAYSGESGTDQCDCDTVVDTAMGTGFPSSSGVCGAPANRCLYYGSACDTSSTENIALAELRAPFHDATIVMVNTSRYGGCGGSRAVYSAGNPSATEIAIHELGHSLAGLADEYGGYPGCVGSAGEVNTSINGLEGAWPEWIASLGPPVEGAQYYDQCLYRPSERCQMRSLANEFCPVCQQHWARIILGHPRVRPSTPIAGLSPGPEVEAVAGTPVELSIETRLPGSGTVNLIDWFVSTPGDGESLWVAGASPTLTHTFESPGVHGVTARVVADAEVIKPERWGNNVGEAVFEVTVSEALPPVEISPPGSGTPLEFEDGSLLSFGTTQAPGDVGYNVYRGDLALLEQALFGSCLEAGLSEPFLIAGEPPPQGGAWFFLATARNAAGEGPLGETSAGEQRTALAPCD